MRRFPIGQHPYIGGNSGVIENIERQGHDGFQPVIFNDPSPDIAFSLSSIAGKQRRAIVNFGDATAKSSAVLHFAELICQKQQLPVAGTGKQLEFRIVCMFDHKTGVLDVPFAAHALHVRLPAFAVGWIGKHEVKFFGWKRITRQC